MSERVRCRCQSCNIRGLTGPAIVITIGVLFLAHEMQGGHFDFGYTWPVLLVVIGALQLGSAFASREGHVDSQLPAAVAPPPTPPAANPPQSYSGTREQ